MRERAHNKVNFYKFFVRKPIIFNGGMNGVMLKYLFEHKYQLFAEENLATGIVKSSDEDGYRI